MISFGHRATIPPFGRRIAMGRNQVTIPDQLARWGAEPISCLRVVPGRSAPRKRCTKMRRTARNEAIRALPGLQRSQSAGSAQCSFAPRANRLDSGVSPAAAPSMACRSCPWLATDPGPARRGTQRAYGMVPTSGTTASSRTDAAAAPVGPMPRGAARAAPATRQPRRPCGAAARAMERWPPLPKQT